MRKEKILWQFENSKIHKECMEYYCDWVARHVSPYKFFSFLVAETATTFEIQSWNFTGY